MKYKLSLLLLFVTVILQAQVTTNPSVITTDQVIEILFDATQGNKGMVGATECYAYTGLITSSSSGSSDWKYAPTWGDNSAKYKMVSVGTDKWKLTITPNIRSFYGVSNPQEKVKQLAFVFRNGDSSKEGKTATGGDIFVKIPQNVEFVSPGSISVTSPSEKVNIEINAANASNLSLFLDNTDSTPLTTAANATSLTFSQTFVKGDHNLIAQAVLGDQTYRDTVYLCSFSAPFSRKVRPDGVKEGITRQANGDVTFCFYAPNTSSMFLLGDFNDYKPSVNYVMNYDYESNAPTLRYYWFTVSGLDPNTEHGYQYLANRTIRCADPYSEKILDPWNDVYISSSVYPGLKSYPLGKTTDPVSVFTINKPTYNWQINNFTASNANNLLVYELLVRDFTSEGTIKAATQKLDYIKSLGMTAVELMPIQEFDGNDSWGYNPNFYFAPDKAYGTSEDYKAFIDECHKRGLAVILDVVFNHSWGQFPWCKLYWDATNNRPATNNPFFNAVAPHPYSVGNDFKHSNSKVRGYFKNVLAYWLQEYKVDGFRFDLSKGFTDKLSDESNVSTYDASRISYIKEYIDTIKVVNPNAYAILEHFCATNEESELANDGAMLWRNLNGAYCQSAMGYVTDSDFSGLYYGLNMPAGSLMGYMESHDEERTAYKAVTYGDYSLKNSLEEQMKQAANNAAFFLTVPGPKMVWQFGELGYDISINQNGRTGRKPILWNYYDDAARKGLYDNYSKLNALRNSYPDLFSTGSTFSWQVGTSDWDNGRFINIESADKQKHVVVAGNFSSSAKSLSVTFPHAGTWYNYLDRTPITVTTAQVVQVPSHEFRLYTDFYPLISGIKDVLISEKEVCGIDVYSINGMFIKRVKEASDLAEINLKKGCYIIRTNYVDGTASVTKILK